MTHHQRKVFATLGPAGSNHDLNTRRYIGFHGLDADIRYVEHFFDALSLMREGVVDFTIQVCAHPDVALTIERHHREIFLIDSFIGPTRPMGVLTRKDVEKPRSLGYMVATRGYFDPGQWETRTEVISNSRVAQGLLAGEYDSGFTSTDLAQEYPDRFRIDQVIGEVDVVWLVYGMQRVRTQELLAWKDAPAARLLRA
ncbi:hypothetical protein [Variovorax terrae]|uniref:Uncharacterized protein n=1 Tax=Variovorax terrae TaxID=2923278 RepID=A0A9X1VUS1_9BURK|nr:hypothetical protein [Variovorax terrae]MCJ0764231.1 hypothetical protein [Variovorax terrae]